MRKNRRSSFWMVVVASLAAALSACGRGDGDMMSSHRAAFDEHASSFQAELAGHRAAVEAAPDLSQMVVLETEHASRAQPHMTAMRDELGDMMGCMGPSGARPDVTGVFGDLDRLQQECDEHRAAMAAAADVESARSEESLHQTQMTGMMADMEMHAGTMMGSTDGYTCTLRGP